MPPNEYDDGTYMYEASMTRSAILYILSAILEPTPQSVSKIANLAANLIFETVLIQYEIANSDWSKKPFDEQQKDIAHHPFWLRELVKQNNALQQLKEMKTLEQNFIERFRVFFANHSKSLIDLS